MDGNEDRAGKSPAVPGRHWWRRRWFKIVASLAVLACAALVFVGEYLIHNAEPILRKRIIETLSERFDAPVELDQVEISLLKGIEVDGYGLRIPFGAGVANTPAYPMIGVQHFAFRTSWKGLMHEPTNVAGVQVDGMEVHIPPPAERKVILGTREGLKPADPNNPKIQPKIAIVVQELHCREVKLYVESGKPNKDPLGFDIAALDMRNVGRGQAMFYDAQLTNPKPVGQIHAAGHFGPWGGISNAGGDVSDPGQTPVDGDYTFGHADLNSIRGLGGILSSTGHFSGVLDRIAIDGKTDTPDFSLDMSNRPVPLHTDFHAIVDGTSGDTYLEPVRAVLAASAFTTTGKVVKVRGKGHDIQLDVVIPEGRMQDFLRLAVRTTPPLMNGVLSMKAKLHIPPGPERVAAKISMAGSFHIDRVVFNNARMQDRLDGLSVRAQGHPGEVKEVSEDRRPEAHSELTANFTLGRGVMSVSEVHYAVPGALVLLNGVYSMDGRLFEFKGHVRTEATASQMVGGWKGWLLKPVDRFLKKDGAGVELPIEISGTEGDVHFGLATHGTDETPNEMLADVKGKEHERREEAEARRKAAEADAEDAKAARAPTLAAAEQAHNAAVRHRAEAQNRALAAQRQAGTPER
ncbi:MAG TPA: hypothetical protein VKV02_02795 [Acidobacteriaceae bacterium]|nr:hypothetical protein [Acidobacteriaceae bacterium]